jgi:hypothetical protein
VGCCQKSDDGRGGQRVARKKAVRRAKSGHFWDGGLGLGRASGGSGGGKGALFVLLPVSRAFGSDQALRVIFM